MFERRANYAKRIIKIVHEIEDNKHVKILRKREEEKRDEALTKHGVPPDYISQ